MNPALKIEPESAMPAITTYVIARCGSAKRSMSKKCSTGMGIHKMRKVHTPMADVSILG